MFLSIHGSWRRFLCAAALLVMCSAESIATEVQIFDLDEGDAKQTLKQFAKQAQIGILFNPPSISGVQTNEVVGKFTTRVALERMLEGTPLVFNEDLETGAFAVTRSEIPSLDQTTQNTEPQILDETEMNTKNNNWLKTLAAILTLGVVGAPELAAQVEDDEEDLYELSPFAIEEDPAQGYRATSTLAGTRINTQMRDVGAAISIMTDEFFEDTGATDAGTVLSYGLGTEVSGLQGNFAGGTPDNIGYSVDAQRTNPQRNGQRIRGLAPASITRGYFLTDIPFDNYNTDRVTIVRGPNSLLFGVGSVGGVINNSVKAASLGENFGEFQVRVGERSSHREVLDINRVLIKDRLAVRLIGLHDENQYQQRPAFEIDKRLHGSFEAVLAKNENSDFLDRTILRGNFEDGSIHGTPPNIIPPGDGISIWFNPTADRSVEAISGRALPAWVDDGSFEPKITIDTRPGINNRNVNANVTPPFFVQFPVIYNSPTAQVASVGLPGDPTVAGVEGRVVWKQAAHGRNRFDVLATTPIERGGKIPGFTRSVIMDRNILDYENMLISGNSGGVEQDFDVQNFSFDQGFLNGKAGLELVYDRQNYHNFEDLAYDEQAVDVNIDVSEYLSNDQPNPNLGKAFIDTGGINSSEEEVDREAFRATAFYDLDFRDKEGWLGHLGRHVFTGFYSDQTIDTTRKNYDHRWINASPSTDVRTSILNHPLNGGRRRIHTVNYLTDSLLDPSIKSAADVRITQYLTSPVPRDGDTYLQSYNFLRPGASVNPNPRTPGDPSFYDEFTVHKTNTNGSIDQRKIESKAISWQSFLFGGNLVGLVGWRTDENVEFEQIGNALLPDGEFEGEFDPANYQLESEPAAIVKGDTLTKSLVGHFPEDLLFQLPGDTDLSVHYNESENFSPEAIRRNIFGKVLPAPTGSTKEYGFTLELLDRKLAIRVNWFEMASSSIDAPFNPAGLINQSYAQRWKFVEQQGIPLDDVLQQSKNDSPNADFSKVTSYEYIQEAIRTRFPSEIQSLINFRFPDPNSDISEIDPIVGLSATQEFVSEGFEVDVVGNLTDNWRVALNIGQQETITSNIAPDFGPVAAIVEANLRSSQVWDLQAGPDVDGVQTIGRTTQRDAIFPYVAAKAKEGTISQEQREWRINFTTNYVFGKDTFLRGFGVGGAIRYQSKIAAGYPLILNEGLNQVPVVDSPFFGPAQTNGDLWASYNRPIMDGKYHWKIQLNARNAIGDNSAIPVLFNPDGALTIIRMPNPREVFLTNTISF